MKKLQTPLILLLTVVLACGVFLLCYRYDNKYTMQGPRARYGVLMLDEDKLERYPFVYLIDGWEIYRGKLLTPEALKENWMPPDEYIFIGQYGGFEGRDAQSDPHGSATYRLSISLPSEMRSYMLELPEIYSAYNVYINGILTAEMGETDIANYRAHTGNNSITVQSSEHLEILIAVSDYSHFYSGMVYPPAFGKPEAVGELLNTRLVVRSIACAVAACLGLLFFGVRLLTGNRKNQCDALNYAALCFCFILYTGYPIIKTLGFGWTGWYIIENFAFCTMLILVMLIQHRLTGMTGRLWKFFLVYAGLVCYCALTAPLWVNGGLNLMLFYSQFIELYYWVCAIYLTTSAVYGVVQGRFYGKIMLAGNIVFDVALIMSRILPIYEPIRFGWFTELAGAVMVMFTGIVLARDIVERYRLSWVMESRVETVSRMLDVQRAYYPMLLEREKEVKTARHDLRHHILVIRRLVSQGSGEKLDAYLSSLENRESDTEQVFYCEHYVVNTLLELYSHLARQQETDFIVRAELPETVPFNDAELSIILSNLMENALNAVLKIPVEQRRVTVTIGLAYERIGIIIQNPFAAKPWREGIGLASVRTVCRGYGGSAEFYAGTDNIFHSDIMLPLKQEGGAS